MADLIVDLASLPLWGLLGLFALSSAVVWFAASRATRYAGAISQKTSLGEGFVGMVVLAVGTSLPELGATATASLEGNAPLAGGNLLGGVAMQTVVIAIADIATRRPLTSGVENKPLLVETGILALLLVLALVGIAAGGGPPVLGFGAWTLAIGAAYIAGIALVRRARAPRVPGLDGRDDVPEAPEVTLGEYVSLSIRGLGVRFAAAAVVILIGGNVLAESAAQIATATGAGAGFIGGTLLALATSLPELSSTIEAGRRGLRRMAVANVFGSNAADVFLLLVADGFLRRGPILGRVGGESAFLGGLALALTAVYLVGFFQRRHRAVGRIGADSAIVLVVYVASVLWLYVVG